MRYAAAVMLAATLAAIVSVSPAIAADQTVQVYVDENLQSFDPSAIVRNAKAYGPLRHSATVLGATVTYDEPTGTITMVYCDKTIRLKPSQGLMVSGAVFVPLRKLSEAFGCTVSYDPAAVAVRIAKPKTGG